MAPGEAGEPVVIQGAMEEWPALTRWRDPRYLLAVAGRRSVPVEVGSHYLAEGWGTRVMTLAQFMHSAGYYLAQHALFDQVPRLARDVHAPDYTALGNGAEPTVNAWLGPAGTVTPLHYDPARNLLCQVVGHKYIRLYAPSATATLAPLDSEMHANSSSLDLGSLLALEDGPPGFADLPFWDCVLAPGEMLYIPPRWWHYVQSTSPSFSVSFWWD